MADEIVYLENGVVIEMGSYAQLMNRHNNNQVCGNLSKFSYFIQDYLNMIEANSESIDKIQAADGGLKLAGGLKGEILDCEKKSSVKVRKKSFIKMPESVIVGSSSEVVVKSSGLIKKENVESKSSVPAVLQYFKVEFLKVFVFKRFLRSGALIYL